VISDEELWRRTEEIEMSMQIKRRKRKWIGHTLRKGKLSHRKRGLGLEAAGEEEERET